LGNIRHWQPDPEKVKERVHDLARRMLLVLALIGEYGLG
jgi:hypothetical protein